MPLYSVKGGELFGVCPFGRSAGLNVDLLVGSVPPDIGVWDLVGEHGIPGFELKRWFAIAQGSVEADTPFGYLEGSE